MTWSSGARYFSPDYGLMAGRVADDVTAVGPLMVDTLEGAFWTYADGVWSLDRDGRQVRRRVVELLGQRYRPSHGRTVAEVLQVHAERFTVGPRTGLINMADGLLRWQADPDPVLIEHNPEEPSTVQLPVTWEPGALCREFDAFLSSALPADDVERAWEVLGYLMMSGNPLQRMFLLSGSGGNGKGVFLNVARALVGAQNFAAVNVHDLADNRFAAADLYGKLANICGEIDSTFIEKTARVKELCGDDDMRAERKGEHGFNFKFWGKALFSANQIPGTSDSSVGWSRRWEVIQFPYAPTKVDPTLSARIVENELPGIAYRAVMALRQLMENGHFTTGESRENAHREFADKANKVRRWLDDPEGGAERVEGDLFNKGTTLLKAFRAWEKEDSGNNIQTGKQKFGELCRQAGLRPVVKRGTRGFYGVRLTTVPFGIPPNDHPWINYESGAPRSAPPDPADVQDTLL